MEAVFCGSRLGFMFFELLVLGLMFLLVWWFKRKKGWGSIREVRERNSSIGLGLPGSRDEVPDVLPPYPERWPDHDTVVLKYGRAQDLIAHEDMWRIEGRCHVSEVKKWGIRQWYASQMADEVWENLPDPENRKRFPTREELVQHIQGKMNVVWMRAFCDDVDSLEAELNMLGKKKPEEDAKQG